MSPRSPRPLLCCLALLALAPAVQAQRIVEQPNPTASKQTVTPTVAPRAPIASPELLPPAFTGLPRQGSPGTATTPQTADPAHAGVLKEDGFVQGSTAQYVGEGASAWTVQVLRFGDATGALSAFTFFRQPGMQPQAVGENAAADKTTFLVRANAALVIVHASGVDPATQDATRLSDAMKALVAALPRVHGSSAIPPTLPALLPVSGLQADTLRYAIGPAGYSGPVPASAIPFDRDAEAVSARYRLHSGATATLTLIMLPTPQIAGLAQRAVAALPDPTIHAGVLRSGPLVGVVSGAGVSAKDAALLLNQIHYAADITLDQPQGYTSKVGKEAAKAAKLLLGIAYLTILLFIAAVVIAVFLGGGRLLLRRLRGLPDSTMNDDDFISLKL